MGNSIDRFLFRLTDHFLRESQVSTRDFLSIVQYELYSRSQALYIYPLMFCCKSQSEIARLCVVQKLNTSAREATLNVEKTFHLYL